MPSLTWITKRVFPVLFALGLLWGTPALGQETIAGCATNTFTDYGSGFNAADFTLTNTHVESNGSIALQTGNDAINPDQIVIPFTQEVFVSFLFEAACNVSDFGWILKEDALNPNGSFKGWNNIPSSARHPVFVRINDDTGNDCGSEGNGILDIVSTKTETSLAQFDDGTGINFVADGDGQVTARDMKKSLGTFAGGTEIVFFLTSNKRWNTTDTSDVFFTQKYWNPDTYSACGNRTFDKIYRLGDPSTSSSCTTNGGWLTRTAVDRVKSTFDIELSGEYRLPITWGRQFAHVIVGAPPDQPNEWILGWEDMAGGGDADHNDLVFHIERKTGGIAGLNSGNAIIPQDEGAYFTAVTLTVWDDLPCPGDTEINYWVSIDNGVTWIEVTDWDDVRETNEEKTVTGSDISPSWDFGSPRYTKRQVRMDFAEKGLSGRALIWKAEMYSADQNCVPKILDVTLEGTVATNGTFSRAEPVVQTNVVYSGSYETPALSWNDKSIRGHLIATRRYAPETPETTAVQRLWDAGEVLSATSPAQRRIVYPRINVTTIAEEVLWKGDGSTREFSGTLAHHPVSALTLRITDTTETFQDKHTTVLEGSLGGTGSVDRFTGNVSLTFKSPPGENVPVKASYTYYTAQSTLTDFTPDNVTNGMLGLTGEYIIPTGYTYDFNNDGRFDDADGRWLVNWIRGYSDGSSTAKEWRLGAVDHSVPAVQVPPGTPNWYYGSAVTDEEKASFDTFVKTHAARHTVVYVGARDGMLHAFDGGKFRWGDNPETDVKENRGYFLWEDTDGNGTLEPNYGDGSELWAFIPANLISRLKNNRLGGDDQAYVDASPTIADVMINGTWHTVLLCAQGNGGDSVTCLDVTDPDNPTFLWEFADPELFRSRSSAAVSQIGRIEVNGKAQWVAFFVSGLNVDANLYPSVYLVDIANGHLLRRIFLTADPENRGKGGVASGQPAIVDSDKNGYIDRIYVGSDKGYLYKVTIPDNPDIFHDDFTTCVINTDFTETGINGGETVPDKYRYQPIYASPAVSIKRSYDSKGELKSRVTILFGTGDSPYCDEDIDTGNTRYNFYAYVDTSANGECSDSDVELSWHLELPAGHRIFASAFSSAGTAYFGTSTAETEDPCEATGANDNGGKIYAVNIETGKEVIPAMETGNIRTTPLVNDEHLYVKTVDGTIDTFGGGGYNNEVIMGSNVKTSVRSWKEVSQ